MSPGTRIYADYNATAPLRPEAKAAMVRALEMTGNPSSVHGEGRKARALVEGTREAVAAAIGACRDDIAFTSGGTEAVGAVLRGALQAMGDSRSVASAIEHDAVTSLVSGKDAWPVLASGVVDLDWLRDETPKIAKQGHRPLVSLMLVNNETGVIQAVAEAAEIVHAAGGLIHCDAIQALGKITTSIIDLDVDYLSVSAHKIGGPQGVGAFYVKPGAPFKAVQTGGGQEFGRRAGTENVAGIAGFGAAVDAAEAGLAGYQALGVARDRMEAIMKSAAPSLQVHGECAPRVAGVSCFGVEGLPSETQIMGLDLAGFAVSAGSACSSGKVKPSRVLTAMGLNDTAARSAIRASFGWASTPEDFDALANAWIRMAARARPQLVKLDAHV
ncbi:MAG: cysteine desulfurase family protein [Hyphomonadaceae bacterium]